MKFYFRVWLRTSKFTVLLVLLILSSILLPPTVWSDDRKINDDTGDADQLRPVIAMHEHGPAIICWQDRRNGDDDIYMQLFGRRGNPYGNSGNVRVNDDVTSEFQSSPDVAMDGFARSVITWQDSRSGGTHIYAQQYMANGRKRGVNFRVNDGPDYITCYRPKVAVSHRGFFIITWEDGRLYTGGDIYARGYGPGGEAYHENILVHEYTGNSQASPAIAMNEHGRCVIAWEDMRSGIKRIYARIFNNFPESVANEFEVSTLADSGATCSAAEVAMQENGNFAVTWLTFESSGERKLYACTFDSLGNSISGIFRVDEVGKFTFIGANRIITYAKTNYLFAWPATMGGDWDVFTRRFYEDGTSIEMSHAVNDPAGNQTAPDVASGYVRNTVFVWSDNRNGNDDIYAVLEGNETPMFVSAGTSFNNKVPISWQPYFGQETMSKFDIYRTDSQSNPLTIVATIYPSMRLVPDQMLDWIDTSVENDKTYYYTVAVESSTLVPWLVEAHTTSYGRHLRSSWAYHSPKIDGTIDFDEWDPDEYPFIANPYAMRPVAIYLKNNNDTLFLAIEDQNDDFIDPGNVLGILFENDNNGQWPSTGPSNEGRITIYENNIYFQGFWGSYPDALGGDAPQANPEGIVAAVSLSDYGVDYEVAIDLHNSPIKAAFGDSIAMAVWVYDPGNFYAYHYGNAGEFPQGALWEAAETLGLIHLASQPASVDKEKQRFPTEFSLKQNHPNPFNPITTVQYAIPKQEHVVLEVIDIRGRSLKKVIDAFHQAGEFSVPIDMREFPSGVYFYRLQAGSFNEVRKMLLVR